MAHGARGRPAARLALVLATLGAALSGCGLPEGGYAPGAPHSYSSPSYYNSPGYHSSPGYYRGHHRSENHHRPPPQPRTENSTQQRLQQHWLNQAQRPR